MSVRGQALVLALLLELIARWAWRRTVVSIQDRIKAANDITSEVVEVPEWDQVKIEVRSMTGKERAKLLKRAAQPDGSMDFEALYPSVLVACCYDPDTGEKVFDDEALVWINEKAAGPVEKLAQCGMKLSGLTQDAVNEGKDRSS